MIQGQSTFRKRPRVLTSALEREYDGVVVCTGHKDGSNFVSVFLAERIGIDGVSCTRRNTTRPKLSK
jgi:Trk K+ transport system NAD-binding subunit